MIYNFEDIVVVPFIINQDNFIKLKQESENLHDELSLMIQWDRDYKLNKIIKNKKEDN